MIRPMKQLWGTVLFTALTTDDAESYTRTEYFRTVATLAGVDPDAVRNVVRMGGPLRNVTARRRTVMAAE